MNHFWEWLTLGSYVAIIYVLVRPGSQGPDLVTRTFQGIAGLTSAETGGGTWSS